MEMKSKYEFDAASREEYFSFPEKYAVEPFRIFGNLYFVGDEDAGIHLVDSGDGLILMDTGYPTARSLLVRAIRKLGFETENIRIILHTHGHFDHFGATGLLVSLSGAKTYLGAADARMFRESPELSLIRCCQHADADIFRPDVELGDGDRVVLGDTTVRCIATPGHSDGVMSYLFNVTEGSRTVTAGVFGGAGLNTLCRPFIERYSRTQAREQFVHSLRKTQDEQVDITLGNHAPQNRTLEKRTRLSAGSGSDNPFIDPSEWQRMISGIQSSYARMLEDERQGTDILGETAE